MEAGIYLDSPFTLHPILLFHNLLSPRNNNIYRIRVKLSTNNTRNWFVYLVKLRSLISLADHMLRCIHLTRSQLLDHLKIPRLRLTPLYDFSKVAV
jgi:hypothetical protein